MSQQSFFDDPPVQQAQAERDRHEGQRGGVARARATDAQSSHDAAERVEASGSAADHTAMIMAVVERGGGWTSYEIAKATGLTNVQVSRRLSGMERIKKADDSLARTCRVCGRKLATYWDRRIFESE